jgi:hypothetical protein
MLLVVKIDVSALAGTKIDAREGLLRLRLSPIDVLRWQFLQRFTRFITRACVRACSPVTSMI